MLKLELLRRRVRESGDFAPASLALADFAVRLAGGGECPELYLAALLAAQAVRSGHSCAELAMAAGRKISENLLLTAPAWPEWQTALQTPAGAKVITTMTVGAPSGVCLTPLAMDGAGRCYLQRYWSFEQAVARALRERAATMLELPPLAPGKLHGLVTFFPDAAHHPALDCQQLAVLTALRRRLVVISGGPGTGKTTVAAAVLALRLELRSDLRIKLAAPTGKAAARLLESLRGNLPNLRVPAAVRTALEKLEAGTLHQLLGARRNSHEFRYGVENPLDCDLLLMDECSMAPLDLMARTVEALNPDAQLILLGDRCQLASVEAGAVLADLCDAAIPNTGDAALAELLKNQTAWPLAAAAPGQITAMPLTGCLVELRENHRFDRDAPLIGQIAGAVRDLEAGPEPAARLAHDIAARRGAEFEFSSPDAAAIENRLAAELRVPRLADGETLADLPRLAADGSAVAREKAFALLDSFRLLAPGRSGKCGIEALNSLMMKLLNLKNLRTPGVPLMVTVNDYRVNLFNGDVGLVCRDAADGRMKVFFPGRADGVSEGDLPHCEPVFAMSVHKSQGSGFGTVVFVMPESDTPLLTRELVYTALTRAEKKLICWGTEKLLASALSRPTRRASGLGDRLRGR